jgi:iron-sulfur cluster repair protein YtfE (RIC family)
MTQDPTISRRGFAVVAGAMTLAAGVPAMAQTTGGSGATTTAPPAGSGTGSATGGDAFAILVDDHQRVMQVFQQIEQTQDRDRRLELGRELKVALNAHALGEESVVYPALLATGRPQAEVQQMFEEHAMMKVSLYNLEALPSDDPRWMEQVTALRRNIEEHVRTEEGTEFPALRQAMNPQQIQTLTRLVMQERERYG